MEEKKPAKNKIDYKAVAKDVVSGKKTFKRAFLDAGGSETQSKKGLKGTAVERPALMKAYKAEVAKQMRRLQMLGQEMNPDEQENFIVGTLVDVASNTKSKGSERAAAVSWMGKSKRVQLFQNDTSVNLFSMQIPSDWQDRYLSTPTIDAIEVKDAVAQKSLEDLPKEDGCITLNSFQPRPFENLPRKLESGKITVPTTMPTTEPEIIPAVVEPPSPAIEQQYEIEVLTSRGGKQQ